MEELLICSLCNVGLELRKTSFSYLGHTFYVELPSCPSCGQVYVDRQLVSGRMREVEIALEDK